VRFSPGRAAKGERTAKPRFPVVLQASNIRSRSIHICTLVLSIRFQRTLNFFLLSI
jgi:hypothetical protein